jgi:hypothetical protein
MDKVALCYRKVAYKAKRPRKGSKVIWIMITLYFSFIIPVSLENQIKTQSLLWVGSYPLQTEAAKRCHSMGLTVLWAGIFIG